MQCENAAVACFGRNIKDCSGTVLLNGESFICLGMKPKVITNEKLLCKKISGIDWRLGNNTFLYRTLAAPTIEDVIATSYGFGLETKVVKRKDLKKLQLATRISPCGLLFSALKCLLWHYYWHFVFDFAYKGFAALRATNRECNASSKQRIPLLQISFKREMEAQWKKIKYMLLYS
eukprot:IDg3232t1